MIKRLTFSVVLTILQPDTMWYAQTGSRRAFRPLRDPGRHRCWRNGRGVQGAGHSAGSHSRCQGRRGAVLRTIRTRGARHCDRAGFGNLDIWGQKVESNEAIRLTSDPANESEPSFSPDGTRIAFRSERDGGGIYVVPALGGDARKLVDRGRSPRFSPDGKWIAYCEIGYHNFHYPGSASVFVIPSSGGEPRRIQPSFASAAFPIGSPDGTHLAFMGLADAKKQFQSDGHPAYHIRFGQ